MVEAVSYAPERTAEVLADGRPRARWRTAMGLPEPSARLGAAIESMKQALGALDVVAGEPGLAFDGRGPGQSDRGTGSVRGLTETRTVTARLFLRRSACLTATLSLTEKARFPADTVFR